MNWYLKQIIAQSTGMLGYLESLGATTDIVQYVGSLDASVGQLVMNEFRKNPSLTLEQLQQFQPPQKVNPYTEHEMGIGSAYAEPLSTWALVNLRKIRMQKDIAAEADKPFIHNKYMMLIEELPQINDWLFRGGQNVEISSYTPEQAMEASDEWHKMMAGEGEGMEYEPTNSDMIIYGPEWKNPEFKGWTIQKVIAENDLKAEGNKMDHCVGGYCQDVEVEKSVIYSLRDPQNSPHVTIEVGGDKGYGPGEIKQIQGKSNSIPKDEYKAMVKEWISTSGDNAGIVRDVNAFEKMEDDISYGQIGGGVVTINEQMEKILQGEENEYGLKYVLDKDMEDVISELVGTGESENSGWNSRRDDEYYGDIAESSPYVSNLALMQDLKLPHWPRHSGEWEELRKMPKESEWKNIQEVERWANETIEELQEDFYSYEIGLEYPQEENYENSEDYNAAMEDYYEAEGEVYNEWLKQSVKGGMAVDLLDEINSFRKEGIVPSSQELLDRKKKQQEEAITSSPAYQRGAEGMRGRVQEVMQRNQASSSWYKIAQINGGKVKYGPFGEVYILGKNPRIHEGQWRISYIDESGEPSHHEDFDTYEKALFTFNHSIEGKEAAPDLTTEEAYELV